MSLPACASAALLQKIVPRSNPLKESSRRVEPLMVRLCPVNLHLVNKTLSISLNISLIFWRTLFSSILLPCERLPLSYLRSNSFFPFFKRLVPLKDCSSFLATPCHVWSWQCHIWHPAHYLASTLFTPSRTSFTSLFYPNRSYPCWLPK